MPNVFGTSLHWYTFDDNATYRNWQFGILQRAGIRKIRDNQANIGAYDYFPTELVAHRNHCRAVAVQALACGITPQVVLADRNYNVESTVSAANLKAFKSRFEYIGTTTVTAGNGAAVATCTLASAAGLVIGDEVYFRTNAASKVLTAVNTGTGVIAWTGNITVDAAEVVGKLHKFGSLTGQDPDISDVRRMILCSGIASANTTVTDFVKLDITAFQNGTAPYNGSVFPTGTIGEVYNGGELHLTTYVTYLWPWDPSEAARGSVTFDVSGNVTAGDPRAAGCSFKTLCAALPTPMTWASAAAALARFNTFFTEASALWTVGAVQVQATHRYDHVTNPIRWLGPSSGVTKCTEFGYFRTGADYFSGLRDMSKALMALGIDEILLHTWTDARFYDIYMDSRTTPGSTMPLWRGGANNGLTGINRNYAKLLADTSRTYVDFAAGHLDPMAPEIEREIEHIGRLYGGYNETAVSYF